MSLAWVEAGIALMFVRGDRSTRSWKSDRGGVAERRGRQKAGGGASEENNRCYEKVMRKERAITVQLVASYTSQGATGANTLDPLTPGISGRLKHKKHKIGCKQQDHYSFIQTLMHMRMT